MTLILGINAFHGDSSACLLRDGEMIAAAEEERFRRIKHWAGFPTEAIRYCLAEAGARLADMDHVAVNHDPSANRWARLRFLITSPPSPQMLAARLRSRRRRDDLAHCFAHAFPGETLRGRIEHIEHHEAHLASAFFVSPFESAACVSVDGFGDFASTAWGAGKGDDIHVDGRVLFPHSLGIFYQAITQFIGFPHYGDEYKVMGLAPYGQPAFMDAMRSIVRLQDDGTFRLDLDCFVHHRAGFDYQAEGGAPTVGDLFSPRLAELLGPRRRHDEPLEQRHKDIARSAQQMYEEAFFHLLGALHRRYGSDAVVVAGGCAMNSVANGKITERTPFRRVYVQSAAGDAGGAIGAAYGLWHRLGGQRGSPHLHAYWGPSYDAAEIGEAVAARQDELARAGCTVSHPGDERTLCRETAEAIAAGDVVGWFQGRMEWGPRALGNRSILADPRRAEMKDILNAKIKRRESFRPFAPSVLREAVPEWFEADADVPFMMQVHSIRPDRRASIPAVTHVDGTGRLQTVAADANPRYHALISAFRDLTGVPMVLNTSFNENEPVVCTPQQAIDCFLRTRMDRLVLGDTVLRRGG
jgi:carbamoyltransferase